MWEGIDEDQTTKEDVTWIVEGMRNNTLIWVTDGSYDRKKAKEPSRAGWIIFCTRTGLRLKGTFWEKSNTASSFFSGDVRPLRITPICASSSGVPQGGTMVINDLL